MNCYLETELQNGTAEWDVLREGFMRTSNFEYGFESIDEAQYPKSIGSFGLDSTRLEHPTMACAGML